jgi:hypothetical protein
MLESLNFQQEKVQVLASETKIRFRLYRSLPSVVFYTDDNDPTAKNDVFMTNCFDYR